MSLFLFLSLSFSLSLSLTFFRGVQVPEPLLELLLLLDSPGTLEPTGLQEDTVAGEARGEVCSAGDSEGLAAEGRAPRPAG